MLKEGELILTGFYLQPGANTETGSADTPFLFYTNGLKFNELSRIEFFEGARGKDRQGLSGNPILLLSTSDQAPCQSIIYLYFLRALLGAKGTTRITEQPPCS